MTSNTSNDSRLGASAMPSLTKSTTAAFRVVRIDEEKSGGRTALRTSGLRFRDEYDLMVFNGLVVNGRYPAESLARVPAEDLIGTPGTNELAGNAGLYVVQYHAPVRDEWERELRSIGVDFIQPVPMNAYVVHVAPENAARLQVLRDTQSAIQYVDAYHPIYRLRPALYRAMRTGGVPTDVTIQLVDGPKTRETIAWLRGVAEDLPLHVKVGPYVNVQATIDPALLLTLSRHPEVFAVEERLPRRRLDEAQGQIVAGNIAGAAPTGPGYLAWLAGEGFGASQFGSFSINVVDDSASLAGHPDIPGSRIDFALNPSNQGTFQDGHGFINAHIVAGFNNGTGSAVEDTSGYNYGLGIAPWAQVGVTAIFGNTNATPTGWENNAYNQGARISSNSWGFTIYNYDSNAQEFDFLVRDARSGQAGNQEYTMLVAAGNDGPTSNTIGSPATAKNIICVGASENYRPAGFDGCGTGPSGADDIDDIIGFSSRGPVNPIGGDARWKPDLVAPGTHIQGGVPQSNYTGNGVCDQYWPAGQTLYGWSSGTSHSTPAVAGAAGLAYQWFLNNGLAAPSPAMVKAVLMASPDYMNGTGAAGTLPHNSQGMGRINLGRTFDGTAKLIVDQSQVLGATGETFTLNGNVDDAGEPFRVTLVWTDAPGSSTAAPYVNDLDLTVTVGGNTYRGNVFAGANSTTGGSADFRNNAESVFLPAGISGAFTVTVTAASVGGNGIPGNADSTDQDFAIFVHNGNDGSGPAIPAANFTGTPTSGFAPLTVNFTDTSTGMITSRSWTFGDGGTSSATNPSRTYQSPGTYTVQLMVTGPGGSDTEVKTGYITVTPPPAAGISDGSFESQTSGSAPTGAWPVTFGTANVINPNGTASDNGVPTAGTQWLEVAGDGSNDATPPSNPGGATNAPIGGAGVEQTFTYPTGQTIPRIRRRVPHTGVGKRDDLQRLDEHRRHRRRNDSQSLLSRHVLDLRPHVEQVRDHDDDTGRFGQCEPRNAVPVIDDGDGVHGDDADRQCNRRRDVVERLRRRRSSRRADRGSGRELRRQSTDGNDAARRRLHRYVDGRDHVAVVDLRRRRHVDRRQSESHLHHGRHLRRHFGRHRPRW